MVAVQNQPSYTLTTNFIQFGKIDSNTFGFCEHVEERIYITYYGTVQRCNHYSRNLLELQFEYNLRINLIALFRIFCILEQL